MREMLSNIAVLTLVACVTGCTVHSRNRGAESVPAVTGRRIENLRAVASRHMACPIDAIEAQPLTEQVWQAHGCGNVREFEIVQQGRVAQWRPITPANVRASNELACPVDRLAVSAPTDAQRDVSGCGRSASYQMSCSAVQCEWVMTDHSGNWTRPGGVTVTPPGQQPAPSPPPIATPRRDSTVVVPEYGDPYRDPRGYGDPAPGGAEPAVDRAIRQALDAQRTSILQCAPVARGLVVNARWNSDGIVQLSLNPPWAGTPTEQCVRRSVGIFQVTTGRPGMLTHIVQ
ncbi:MAG: hypothetical protein M3Y87_13450 [Myxococcota bacterium]|nr:hypothetical protein [Myxococcota bacterium]